MMKKATIVFTATVCILSLLSWSAAQGSKPELFDAKKAQQEIEIMRGILNTTLSIVSKELQGRTTGSNRHELLGFRNFSNVGAFYLYGQGATFTVPVSATRFALSEIDEPRIAMEAAQAELEVAAAALESTRAGRAGGLGKGTGSGSGQGTANAPKTVQAPVPPTQPPAPPAPPKQEEVRKRVAEAQEQLSKRRETMEKQRQKQQEFIAQMKGYLIDALANYGDSITVLRPNEYINLVITTESDLFLDGEWTGSRSPAREIISVQKSTISDYKAGRLSLDSFKSKVLQYNQ
jgi:hypothetical protein